MNYNFFLIICGIQLIIMYIIELYCTNLLNHDSDTSKECSDIFNKTLFTLKFCFWNISHIFIFFSYCVFLKPTSLRDHFFIFLIGVSWFTTQIIFAKYDEITNDITNCPHVSYENILKPKLDDFIYNVLGQMLYVVIFPIFNTHI